MKNIITPLAKSVLIPLGFIATMSAGESRILKNILGLGFTTLIISNEQMEDILKIIKYIKEFGFFLLFFGETIENEAKEQKGKIQVSYKYISC